MPPKILVPLNGKLVRLDYVATLAGVTSACVGRRLKKGMTPEEIIAAPPSGIILQTVTFRKKTITVYDLAKLAGCTLPAMYQRLKKYTPEEAIKMGAGTGKRGAPSGKIKRKFKWGGKENLSYADLAVIRGVSESTMRLRVCYMGLECAMSNESTPRTRLEGVEKTRTKKQKTNSEWGDLDDLPRCSGLKDIKIGSFEKGL